MNKRYNYLDKFSVLPIAEIWEKEFTPILDTTPAIGEYCKAAMAEWVEYIRDSDPDFAADLELPIKFDPVKNPLKLSFYATRYGPQFDTATSLGPEQISYWRSNRNRFLFSAFWLYLCKVWMPEGNWLRLDTESHSVLLELNSRTIFDPRFHASQNAEYILEMLIIGEPVKNTDHQQTSNVIAWFNYHLKWHSRYNLPEVFEKALRHDLPDYLQIMRTFANVETLALKSQPLTATQLNAINTLSTPVNRRMI